MNSRASVPLLAGEQLSFRIDDISIIQGVDFEVHPGEMIGLIGPNGAGKSTLLKLLLGLLTPTAGRILLGQQSLDSHDLKSRAVHSGYLAQGARAAWPMTVQRVVELGRLPHQGFWQRISEQDRTVVDNAMALAEVTAYRNRITTTLSGGEQTLVLLARVFASQPQLIFADEPVAALDPYHQLHVMELLRAHAQDSRATVVVLHDLGLAARFCDRLYLFQHGRIHAAGAPQDVLTEGHLRTVYGIDTRIECTNNGVSITPVRRIRDGHP